MTSTSHDHTAPEDPMTRYSRYHYPQASSRPKTPPRQEHRVLPHHADAAQCIPAPSPKTSHSFPRSRNPVKRQFDLWFILVTSIFALVILAISLFFLYSEEPPVTNTDAFTSTPQSEWVKGVMPTLYQKDTQWAKHPYAEAEFADSGCGPISLTMVHIFLTGDSSLSPTDLADMATAGGFASPAGTDWAFMEEAAVSLGMSCEGVPADRASIVRHLEAGHPIIAIMGAGDFTTTGHFIVIYDIDKNGKLLIKDSNSIEHTKRTWDIDTILSQCRGLWAYS